MPVCSTYPFTVHVSGSELYQILCTFFAEHLFVLVRCLKEKYCISLFSNIIFTRYRTEVDVYSENTYFDQHETFSSFFKTFHLTIANGINHYIFYIEMTNISKSSFQLRIRVIIVESGIVDVIVTIFQKLNN